MQGRGATSLVIASRGSRLALWQASHVRELLRRAHPDLSVDIRIISTRGDRELAKPLADIGGKGLFTEELQAALRQQTCDIAVHSLKDLPTVPASGMTLMGVVERANAWDVLVVRGASAKAGQQGLRALNKGAVLGTSSPRRAAQARMLRPDLVIKDLRGNVETRLNKCAGGEYDAVILAAAGLERIGLMAEGHMHDPGLLAWALEAPTWLSAPGQGAIGIEGRAGDQRVAHILAPVHHALSAECCAIERQFLHACAAGCQAPLGALARPLRPNGYALRAGIFALDGARAVVEDVKLSPDWNDGLQAFVDAMLRRGGAEILAQVREQAQRDEIG